jgi:hypothetical protein
MLARWKAQQLGNGGAVDTVDLEEIHVIGCYGTDTDILNADMRRALEALPDKTDRKK